MGSGIDPPVGISGYKFSFPNDLWQSIFQHCKCLLNLNSSRTYLLETIPLNQKVITIKIKIKKTSHD